MPEIGNYAATTDAHGLYNTFQFVLRLSPLVHRRLAEIEPGVTNSSAIGFDHARAFSTYLHETIHWWQHIGSTYGFMMSLSYPTQLYANYNRLRTLIDSVGFRKPLRKMGEIVPGPGGYGTPRGEINTIVNNHFDFTAFRQLTFNERLARRTVEDPYFESIGHAFYMTYAHNIFLLASTADREFEALPDPREWEDYPKVLREMRQQGFYYGSPVELWGVGAHEIMEGQACFSQMQYLAFGSGGNLGWDDFREIGMLHGVYEVAFQHFLNRTHLEWPPSLDHPTVGLFLLICDMALNPGAGFPLPILYPHAFIDDTDPGARFQALSTIARLSCPEVMTAIKTYSREEYVDVSEKLATAMKIHSPLAAASKCAEWAKERGPFASLMAQYKTFDYDPINMPVRVLFTHFLAFMEDKHRRPEYFCWPAAWMTGGRVSAESRDLFEKHSALFIDKEDDDGIFPRLHTNRDQNLVQRMFDDFYAANVAYDMTTQWITDPGPFRYEYDWLKQDSKREEMKAFVDRQFRNAYGVDPDSATIL